jgi:cation diffusion facilitator family transporter
MRNHDLENHHLYVKSNKTGWVLLISIATMLLEIIFGHLTNSMALLSDGWHMTSHVIAIGVGWLTYKYVLYRHRIKNEVNANKILSIAGFINATALAGIAIFVFIESIERFCMPVSIKYNEAIIVSIIGLIVNIASAKILHHEEEHSDHNLKATYLHILADILTSLLAIIALLGGMCFQLYKGDAIVGIIGSLVILHWSKNIIIHAYKQIFNNSTKPNVP